MFAQQLKQESYEDTLNLWLSVEMDKKLKLTAPADTDVIVLAGDISEGTDAVAWAQESYGMQKPIIYIC